MKKWFCILILSCLSYSAIGQIAVNQNYPKFDKKWFHFGFALGINVASFNHRLKLDPTFSDSLQNLNIKAQPGFYLGVITSFKIHTTLRIRIIPSLSFYERSMEYTFLDGVGNQKAVTYKSNSTSIEFPLLLKWRTYRVKNFAAYLIGGAQYSLDLAAKDKAQQTFAKPLVKTSRHGIHGTLGLGLDFFMPYFKFGIELRYNHGLRNELLQENYYLDRPIDKLYSKSWLISITFEG